MKSRRLRPVYNSVEVNNSRCAWAVYEFTILGLSFSFINLCHEGADKVVLEEFGDERRQRGCDGDVGRGVVGEEHWRIVIDVGDDDVQLN